jgi:hypothetical protein
VIRGWWAVGSIQEVVSLMLAASTASELLFFGAQRK